MLTALASGERTEIERRLAAAVPGNDYFNRRLSSLLDDPRSAQRYLRERLAGTPTEPLPYVVIAHWAAYFGDPEMALELLQQIQARGDQAEILSATIWRPVLSDVRRLAGFATLVENLGLVRYWHEYGWADLCQPTGENALMCE